MKALSTRIFFTEDRIISGLAKHTDISILSPTNIIYNKELNKARTIFLSNQKENYITDFISHILPKLNTSVNLIIASSDQTYPNCLDKRSSRNKINYQALCENKFINKIFVENLDQALPKTYPIPLGINPKICPTDLSYFLQFENINNQKPAKITNFNILRHDSIQWSERHYVKNLCDNFWAEHYIIPDISELTHKDYLKFISQYMFSVCVHGGGLDVNPKIWESLLVGVIPIIRENKPYTDIYIDLDLPVVIVEDWRHDTITLKQLTVWRDKYYHHFTDPDKRRHMLYKLSIDYWIDYVKKK